MSAERCWAHAMELKKAIEAGSAKAAGGAGSTDALRKRRHAVLRLAKASRWAAELARFAAERCGTSWHGALGGGGDGIERMVVGGGGRGGELVPDCGHRVESASRWLVRALATAATQDMRSGGSVGSKGKA